MMKFRRAAAGLLFTLISFSLAAQTKTLSLEEAVQLGVQNSKQLKLSQNKILQATSRLEQAKDAALPSAKVSAGYNHALMLARKFSLPSSDGQGAKIMEFPFDNALYQATISINQPVFAAHQYRYARESANLLIQSS